MLTRLLTAILFVFLMPPMASAERISNYTTQDEKLRAVLSFVFDNEAAKFGWPADTQAMWCPTNIDNLLQRLVQARVDLSRAKVWYIQPKQGQVLKPLKARDGVNEWTFHVVLEIEGRVMDLDYTSAPTLVSSNDYLKQMWAPKARLFVREIPAQEYLSGYRGNWNWYLDGAEGRYPLIQLNEAALRASNP